MVINYLKHRTRQKYKEKAMNRLQKKKKKGVKKIKKTGGKNKNFNP